MTQPTPTFDQLVAAMTAAHKTLTTAQQATRTAQAPWDAALVALKIKAAPKQHPAQRAIPSHTAPTPAPAPALPPDGPTLGALGLALSSALVAESIADAAYKTAKKAHADALANAKA